MFYRGVISNFSSIGVPFFKQTRNISTFVRKKQKSKLEGVLSSLHHQRNKLAPQVAAQELIFHNIRSQTAAVANDYLLQDQTWKRNLKEAEEEHKNLQFQYYYEKALLHIQLSNVKHQVLPALNSSHEVPESVLQMVQPLELRQQQFLLTQDHYLQSHNNYMYWRDYQNEIDKLSQKFKRAKDSELQVTKKYTAVKMEWNKLHREIHKVQNLLKTTDEKGFGIMGLLEPHFWRSLAESFYVLIKHRKIL